MTYPSLTGPQRWLTLLTTAGLCLAIAACGDGGPDGTPGTGGTGGTGGGGPMGCLTINHPGEPDVLFGPEIEPRVLPPGSTVDFSMFIDGDTRLVKATFMDAWRLRNPPQGQSETVQVPSAEGNTSLDLAIPINTTGRYYVDFELCGRNCDDLRIVYTLNRDNAGPESDAINDPYERIVYRDGVEVSSSATCDKPDSIAIQ